jgi:UDP-glucose 4-epimerase
VTTWAWVLGGRGLLGSAIVRQLDRRAESGWRRITASPLDWNDPEAAARGARAAAKQLVAAASATPGDRWCVIWAAGGAVTSSPQPQLDGELAVLEAVLDAVAVEARTAPATPGALFYASSAGGIYSGSTHPPFDEHAEVAPISPYGRFKLRAEGIVASKAEEAGASALLGRIANLYGPGQRLDKMQGLISHLALAQLASAPASIYVPLETLRDYIYVDDCGALILEAIERLFAEATDAGAPVTATKNLATGRAVSIAELLGHFRQLLRRTPTVVLASSPASAYQAVDLRISSSIWTDLDARTLTPLPVGIRATIDDIGLRLQRSGRG